MGSSRFEDIRFNIDLGKIHSIDYRHFESEFRCVIDNYVDGSWVSTEFIFYELFSILIVQDDPKINNYSPLNSTEKATEKFHYTNDHIFYLYKEKSVNVAPWIYENFNIVIELTGSYIAIGARKVLINGKFYELKM